MQLQCTLKEVTTVNLIQCGFYHNKKGEGRGGGVGAGMLESEKAKQLSNYRSRGWSKATSRGIGAAPRSWQGQGMGVSPRASTRNTALHTRSL